jgi:hypothetical protein
MARIEEFPGVALWQAPARYDMQPVSFLGKVASDGIKGEARVMELPRQFSYEEAKKSLHRNGLDEIHVVDDRTGKFYLIYGRMLENCPDRDATFVFRIGGEQGEQVRGRVLWLNLQDSPQGLLQIIPKAIKVRLEDNPPTNPESLKKLVGALPQSSGLPGLETPAAPSATAPPGAPKKDP